ncbi:MAG: NifU family protein [Bacteroidia bacterium]|nr:NifU family protein [Bacteroidia bacterium]NNJ55276.1 NifU family protein [Bacteroidia bacterium]
MELTDIITVYSEKTPNPESMKFVANKMILPNDSIDFRSKNGLEQCPMAQELFDYDFVKGVFIMNNFVSVTKKADYEWFDIIPQLKKFVEDYLTAEKPIVLVKQDLTDEEESEVVTKIKQLLEDHVKPAVEMDGGAIDFKSFDEGVVTVVMKGSCSGCPSSTLTLKAGIENLLKRMIPEVEAVEAEAA